MRDRKFIVVLNGETAVMIDDLAAAHGVHRRVILARSFALLKVYRDQIAAGRRHLGVAADKGTLEMEIVGLLDPQVVATMPPSRRPPPKTGVLAWLGSAFSFPRRLVACFT